MVTLHKMSWRLQNVSGTPQKMQHDPCRAGTVPRDGCSTASPSTMPAVNAVLGTPRDQRRCAALGQVPTLQNVKNCHVIEDDVNGKFSFPPPVLTGCSELTESSNPTVGMGTGAVCRLRTPRFAEPVGSVHAAPVLGQESALNVENNTERPGRYPAPESPLC